MISDFFRLIRALDLENEYVAKNPQILSRRRRFVAASLESWSLTNTIELDIPIVNLDTTLSIDLPIEYTFNVTG